MITHHPTSSTHGLLLTACSCSLPAALRSPRRSGVGGDLWHFWRCSRLLQRVLRQRVGGHSVLPRQPAGVPTTNVSHLVTHALPPFSLLVCPLPRGHLLPTLCPSPRSAPPPIPLAGPSLAAHALRDAIPHIFTRFRSSSSRAPSPRNTRNARNVRASGLLQVGLLLLVTPVTPVTSALQVFFKSGSFSSYQPSDLEFALNLSLAR